jgi:hypothetical protein
MDRILISIIFSVLGVALEEKGRGIQADHPEKMEDQGEGHGNTNSSDLSVHLGRGL